MSCADADRAEFDRHVDSLAGALAGFVDRSGIMCSIEEYRARMRVCGACPLRRGKGCSFPALGCSLAVLGRIATRKCPDGRW